MRCFARERAELRRRRGGAEHHLCALRECHRRSTARARPRDWRAAVLPTARLRLAAMHGASAAGGGIDAVVGDDDRRLCAFLDDRGDLEETCPEAPRYLREAARSAVLMSL